MGNLTPAKLTAHLFSLVGPLHVGEDILIGRGEQEGVLVEGHYGSYVEVLRAGGQYY
jgi:hypothetical protein